MEDFEKEIMRQLDGLDEFLKGTEDIRPRIVHYSNNDDRVRGLVFQTSTVWFNTVEKSYGVSVVPKKIDFPEGIDAVTRMGKVIRILREHGFRTWAEL